MFLIKLKWVVLCIYLAKFGGAGDVEGKAGPQGVRWLSLIRWMFLKISVLGKFAKISRSCN